MIEERKTRVPANPPFQITNMAMLASLVRKTESAAGANSEPERELTDEVTSVLMKLARHKRRYLGADHTEIFRAFERIGKFRKICVACGSTAPLALESCPECRRQLV